MKSIDKLMQPRRSQKDGYKTGIQTQHFRVFMQLVRILRCRFSWSFRQQFASDIKIIRVMCTGRVDLSFIFRAFLSGKGRGIDRGCHPGECHYVTQGNYGALSTLHIGRKLLETIGLNPERLRLEFIAASEGNRYAEVMNDFSSKAKELGPMGEGEGIDEAVLKRKLKWFIT